MFLKDLNTSKIGCLLCKSVVGCLLAYSTTAQAVTPSVSLPGGLNLGGTSFFDGFSSSEPGFTYQVYLQQNNGTSIRDNNGDEAAPFDKPKLDATVVINQFDYKFEKPVLGGNVGVLALLPIVGLDADFGDKGPQLVDNDSGLSDVTLAAYFQFRPIIHEGRPVFSQRLELGVILPSGKYSDDVDFNQSSNYVSLSPYWSFTLLPAPRWEISGRLNYVYNFKNSSPAGSAPLDWNGEAVKNTRAGQAAWLNFAASYEVLPNINVGLNGYYLKQISDDQVNGDTLVNSKEEVLGVGPGVFWSSDDKKTAVWLNAYTESSVKNRFENSSRLQFRIVHAF